MSRTHLRRAVAVAAACSGTLALSGCAVIGGQSTAQAVGSDEHLSSSYQLVQPGTLTVCSDIPYPPFEFEQDGEITGYDIELVEAIAEKLELQVNVIDSSFEAIESGASLTGCDLNASSISITDERQRIMAFTSPYLDDDLVLIARKDEGFTAVSDLGDARVGVQAATTGDAYAREQGLNVVQYEDGGMQVQALQAGNVDAVLGNQSVLLYSLKDDDRFGIVEELPTGEQLGMAVGPEKAQLLSAVDRAFQQLRADGTVAELQDKWFGHVQEDYQ
jgi:polar amino acid transport system substrate-binding protein